MDEEIHRYTGEGIEVSYDVRRCIHARECVRGLPDVFDTDQRPWVNPHNADADDIAEVIERCPTGALHYERADDGPEEAVPDENTVTVISDGPHYVRGDSVIETPDDEQLLADTRIALCRCGASDNKPLCDNSHLEIEFEAPGTVEDNSAETGATGGGGRLSVVPTPDGPLHVSGPFEMSGEDDGSVFRGTDVWLCRCGHSEDKPFCDGTHGRIGFSTEGE
ncbi:CDGSH iron-sulfur domain-containing protein [Haloprofundus sp. MHR1]|uniref:CDGSH iron-sulfur domain-containing protein n=1 Tax=Haloprofundus sp. MHR1 TaxID=2572921 RepID=UPI0010BEC691|nr:CDGSH iron-sulfur domain-containing protein [Haloprofundus sp. MHR1]QCJ47836.1 hypothetical protein FCF25_12230 [Haloprofundus sp. MHR1]